jgi:hypothetical protein
MPLNKPGGWQELGVVKVKAGSIFEEISYNVVFLNVDGHINKVNPG